MSRAQLDTSLARRLPIAVVASVFLHGGILFAAQNLPKKPPEKPERIELRVIEPKKIELPPPPPPAPEPPKPEPPKPKPIEAPKRNDPAPPPKGEPPPPPKAEPPPPPPQGFSVDLESTVSAGAGPAVVAVEGGGNLFADPSKGGPAGKRQAAPQAAPSPAPDGVEGGTGLGIVAPELIIGDADKRPPYPAQALAQEVEGQVTLQVVVGVDGRVVSVKVIKGLGFGCDEAARDWVKRKYVFKPGRRSGQAVEMSIPLTMTFELDR